MKNASAPRWAFVSLFLFAGLCCPFGTGVGVLASTDSDSIYRLSFRTRTSQTQEFLGRSFPLGSKVRLDVVVDRDAPEVADASSLFGSHPLLGKVYSSRRCPLWYLCMTDAEGEEVRFRSTRTGQLIDDGLFETVTFTAQFRELITGQPLFFQVGLQATGLNALSGLGVPTEAQFRALSAGAQQRVAIAQASLGLDAPLLLLDEPSSNLDSEEAERISRLIRAFGSRDSSLHARLAMIGPMETVSREGLTLITGKGAPLGLVEFASVPADDSSDLPLAGINRFDVDISLAREISLKGIIPAVDSLNAARIDLTFFLSEDIPETLTDLEPLSALIDSATGGTFTVTRGSDVFSGTIEGVEPARPGAPLNDDPDRGLPLETGVVTQGTTFWASEAEEGGGPAVWFGHKALLERMRALLQGNFEGRILVRDDNLEEVLTRRILPLSLETATVAVEWDAVPGTRYSIGVAGTGPDEFGAFQIKLEGSSPAGAQMPGDCNQDGSLDLSDAVCFLQFLFLDAGAGLPCGDGTSSAAGNGTLFDCNGDQELDLSDGVCVLNYLFLGTQEHHLGSECVVVEGCSALCAE